MATVNFILRMVYEWQMNDQLLPNAWPIVGWMDGEMIKNAEWQLYNQQILDSAQW